MIYIIPKMIVINERHILNQLTFFLYYYSTKKIVERVVFEYLVNLLIEIC